MNNKKSSSLGLRTLMQKKFILLLGVLLLLILIISCDQPSQPEQAFQNPCSQINSLTCRSPSATGGVFCCMNLFNQNAATGYACVLGRDQFAGCYSSLEQARQLGCGGSIVRCVKE
ncbi:hypothetical protein HZA97_08990 [Candidatus Woesearchaeota archaeon]|nr:hypothetical protein [Candidatus Woesearchaeota archaeon]